MKEVKDDHAVDTLQSLVRGEISAIETYRQACDKATDTPFGADLRRIMQEHEASAETLRTSVRRFGATPDTSSGVWGAFARSVEGVAKVFGTNAALKALKEGEEHGLKEYEEALDDDALDPVLEATIRDTLLPKQRAHITALDRIIARV